MRSDWRLPPIHVWGTIGFICAMFGRPYRNQEFQRTSWWYGASALLLGLYSFTLPACKPAKTEKKTLLSSFGLDAFVLFKRKKMAIFFLFSMLLGAALQITNTYGDLFLGSFASIPEFADSFGVKHSVILLSISQMSETLFILAIPFFLRHFGIKRGDADQYVRLGIPVRAVWLRRSGFRSVDADSFHDRVWYGVRLLQHFRFVVC